MIAPSIALIAAVEMPTMGIGYKGDMLYRISDDLRHFRTLTLGHNVVMGRRTWESIGSKPLPGRQNYVLSSDPGFHPEGAEVMHGTYEIKHLFPLDKEVMIMGGATLYEQMINMADTIYLTQIFPAGEPKEADTFFPYIDPDRWHIVEVGPQAVDPASGARYRFVEYERQY